MTEPMIFEGVLRCFGGGFHLMRLEGATCVAGSSEPQAPPASFAVALESTQLRARGAMLVGARVRVRGRIDAEKAMVDGARVPVDVLFHVDVLEDLEPRSLGRVNEQRPSTPPRESSWPPKDTLRRLR